MADSRLFQKAPGITSEKIGRSVENMLRSKGMEIQGGKAGQGYVVQAKSADSWKTLSGMSTALEVQLSDTGNGILVNIGNAKWSDKIGAGVVGAFIFAPLAVTAIVGSVKQKKLPEEIFAHIERFIASGGRDLYLGTDFANASAGNSICPHCGSENPLGQSFCSSCGKPLNLECPGCGKAIPIGTVYCPHCGCKTDTPKMTVCPKCGAQVPDGAAFCSGCGGKIEEKPKDKICVKCGKVNSADNMFCAGCGEKLEAAQEKRVCPGCGAQIDSDSAFCPKCGNKLNT